MLLYVLTNVFAPRLDPDSLNLAWIVCRSRQCVTQLFQLGRIHDECIECVSALFKNLCSYFNLSHGFPLSSFADFCRLCNWHKKRRFSKLLEPPLDAAKT